MSSAASKIYFAAKVVSTKCKENTREQPKSLSFAVLGDQTRNQCRLLIYANKNQHISVASINQNFEFYICEDNDISYVDDAKDQWIVKFANFNTFVDAFRQILLCLYHAGTDWQISKCYRRAHTAFRSPEIGDSVRLAYSLLRCDTVGMKSCLTKDDVIELSQQASGHFEQFLLKHVQSMLTADKKLVIFDGRNLGPIPGISKQTDIMALDLHLIDIIDSDKQSLKTRMAMIGQNIFKEVPLFDDFVDSVEFSNDPVKETNNLPINWAEFVEESRRAHLETKLGLTEINKKIAQLTSKPQNTPEMRSVQIQFSSDNKDRLLSTYRNSLSYQHKKLLSLNQIVSSSFDAVSSRLRLLETRLEFVSNLQKSSVKTVLQNRKAKKTEKNENYNMDQIKKILNYAYRSVKTDLTEAVSTRGFDPTTNEYVLQSLQKTIKGILTKLHSGDQ